MLFRLRGVSACGRPHVNQSLAELANNAAGARQASTPRDHLRWSLIQRFPIKIKL
jgi:hypothetical protein